jgi:hypothetical protein
MGSKKTVGHSDRRFMFRSPGGPAAYLVSPPPVVAFALAGRADIDLTAEPTGYPSSLAQASDCLLGFCVPMCMCFLVRSRRALDSSLSVIRLRSWESPPLF